MRAVPNPSIMRRLIDKGGPSWSLDQPMPSKLCSRPLPCPACLALSSIMRGLIDKDGHEFFPTVVRVGVKSHHQVRRRRCIVCIRLYYDEWLYMHEVCQCAM
jgi:hypothetical protein